MPEEASTPIPCSAAQCTGVIKKVWWGEDGEQVLFWRAEGINDAAHASYAWSPRSRKVKAVL